MPRWEHFHRLEDAESCLTAVSVNDKIYAAVQIRRSTNDERLADATIQFRLLNKITGAFLPAKSTDEPQYTAYDSIQCCIAASFENTIYLFVGLFDLLTTLGRYEILSYDTTQAAWSRPATMGDGPEISVFNQGCHIGHNFYIVVNTFADRRMRTCLHQLNMKTHKWSFLSEVVDRNHSNPHSSVTSWNKYVVVGENQKLLPGPASSGVASGSFRIGLFDTEAKTWYWLQTSGDDPSIKFSSTFNILECENKIFLYEDSLEDAHKRDTTFESYVLDMRNRRWTRVMMASYDWPLSYNVACFYLKRRIYFSCEVHLTGIYGQSNCGIGIFSLQCMSLTRQCMLAIDRCRGDRAFRLTPDFGITKPRKHAGERD